MSEEEKETIEEEDTPILTTLDKDETDIETILIELQVRVTKELVFKI